MRVRSRATEGRANAEAERVLSKLLGADVRLAAGGRSRRKRFDIPLMQAVVDVRLREVFGD